MSVTMTLDDEVDVSRGDMICRPHNHASVGQSSTRWCAGSRTNRSCAPVPSWRSHTTRLARALVRDLLY
jgi:sulfate adenylyltransferase subunit 1 (EFTu-like GTPase family)